MKKHIYSFPLLLLLFLTSCSSVRVLPNKAPVTDISTKELVKTLERKKSNLKTYRARIKATYFDQKSKQQVNINLRLEKDKALWMSANMLIPIAKVFITPTTVAFYEKFQKTAYEGDLRLINEQLGTSFTFTDLQNLFLGHPVSDLKKTKFERIKHPQYYVLSPKDKAQVFRPTYFFDPSTFLLKEQRFLIGNGGQSLSVRYTKRQQVLGKQVPKEMVLSAYTGERYINLTLEFQRVDFPKTLTFPFKIPSGYQSIEL